MENEGALSLHFGLKKGKKADFEVLSAAAIAWVETIRAVAHAIDPDTDVKVELVDAHEGSINFNTIVNWYKRSIEEPVEAIGRGYDKLPRARRIALGIVPFLVVTGIPTAAFYMNLDEDERAEIDQIKSKAEAHPAVETAKRKFFRTVEREPIITSVGVKEAPDAEPLVVVDGSRFAEAGGLWSEEEEDVQERVTQLLLDVVLVKPALVHTPRSWTFKPDGLPEFDAVMRDPVVLQAIEQKGLPDRVKEGFPMTLRLEVREVQIDGQWKQVRGGRSVVRVLSPKFD